jgi:hypothetical protein
MAGLVPAIYVFASHRSARGRCVDARIESGHDELVGILHHLNEPEPLGSVARNYSEIS